MATVESTIDPILSDGEREELRHLDYLSARIADFRDRGLLAADSYEAMADDGRSRRIAIERLGQYRATVRQARALSRAKAGEALTWAQRARELDPDQIEAWVMEIDFLWELQRDDEAVALCAEGAARFPRLGEKEAILRSHLPSRAQARLESAEQARRGHEITTRVEQARWRCARTETPTPPRSPSRS